MATQHSVVTKLQFAPPSHPRPQKSGSVKLAMLHPPTTNGVLLNYNHIVTLGNITKNFNSGYAWKFEKYEILSIFFSNMPSDSMKHAELNFAR